MKCFYCRAIGKTIKEIRDTPILSGQGIFLIIAFYFFDFIGNTVCTEITNFCITFNANFNFVYYHARRFYRQRRNGGNLTLELNTRQGIDINDSPLPRFYPWYIYLIYLCVQFHDGGVN